MTILLPGFKPFGENAENPSQDIVRAVAAAWQGNEKLVAEVRAAGARVRLIDDGDVSAAISTCCVSSRWFSTPSCERWPWS